MLHGHHDFYRAMLRIHGTSHGPVSVCLSVTSRCSTKMDKRRITQTPHPGTLVFWSQRSLRNLTRVTPLRGRQMQAGWVKIDDFRQITSYISKTIQDRCIVSIKVYRMVTLPMTLSASYLRQTIPFSAFCTAIHNFVTGEPRDFRFGTLTYHSKSHSVDKKIFPERRVVRVSWPVLEFYTPCKISATANAGDFKFCIWVGHAKS